MGEGLAINKLEIFNKVYLKKYKNSRRKDIEYDYSDLDLTHNDSFLFWENLLINFIQIYKVHSAKLERQWTKNLQCSDKWESSKSRESLQKIKINSNQNMIFIKHL